MQTIHEMSTHQEDGTNNNAYDIPFGKASQTAKRYEEETYNNGFRNRCRDKRSQDYDNLSSQDLFISPDSGTGNSLSERYQDKHALIEEALDEAFEHTKSLQNKKKRFPSNFVSLEKNDLPHPKQLFKKKRTKKKQTPSSHPYKADLNDKGISAVHGHLQQLKSKLAHRTTQNIILPDETGDAKSTETLYHLPDVDQQSPCVPVERRVQFLSSIEERSDGNLFINKKAKKTKNIWDELEVSLHQRWMTDVSFIEEE